MSKFSSLNVTKITRETPESITVHFAKPSGTEWQYKAGQYLTFKVFVAGKEYRRAYSLCTSPLTDADMAVTVKKVTGGTVSVYMNEQVKEGSALEVFPPMGKFTHEPDAARACHYILIAGGSGITPVMSILKTALYAESKSRVTLIYGNRDEQSIIFREALRGLEQQYTGRLRVVHILENAPAGFTGLTGRPDRTRITSIVQEILSSGSGMKRFYMCGPAAMMDEAEAGLKFLGVQKSDIFRELFTAPLPDLDAPAKQIPSDKKPGTYQVKVILDGHEKTVTVTPDKTILNAAIEAGMDPPYACTMGVCCTCRGKLHSGAVHMDENDGLSDTEIDEGYILTCQSHPLTPDCVVEYK